MSHSMMLSVHYGSSLLKTRCSAVMKLASEIDESATDVGGCGKVSLIGSSRDGTQGIG